MKRLIAVLFLNISMLCVGAAAAGAQHQAIRLTGYSYSNSSEVIGQVVTTAAQGKAHRIKLQGKSRKQFAIDRNNNLVTRGAFSGPDNSMWHDVVIKSGRRKGAVTDTFRIVKDDFNRNRVIAHRGAWKNTGAAQNSLASLQHAIRLGCAGSEFDVHMSADSVLFVFHDLQNIHIEKTDAATLSQLKLPTGESLPTLDAYLREGTKQNHTRLILEIKPSALGKERSLALARQVVRLVQQHKAQAWVDYISFDYDILKKVLALDPFARVSYLAGDVAPEQLAIDKFYGFDYHFNVLKQNDTWISQAHQHNLTVNSWTVNTAELMDWLLLRNADFITTDEPELLLQKVEKRITKE